MKNELTAAKVLGRMKPGSGYAAWEISSLVGWKVSVVRPVVEQMERDGVVVARVLADRHRRFYIAGTEDMKVQKASQADGVATPLIPHLMTGELSGYQVSITRHRDLCMSIRR